MLERNLTALPYDSPNCHRILWRSSELIYGNFFPTQPLADLSELVYFLLTRSAPSMQPFSKTVQLQLFVYADAYDPRGMSVVNIKVGLVDTKFQLLPMRGPHIPGCIDIVSFSSHHLFAVFKILVCGFFTLLSE